MKEMLREELVKMMTLLFLKVISVYEIIETVSKYDEGCGQIEEVLTMQ